MKFHCVNPDSVCVPGHVHECVSLSAHMWRSEDNLGCWFLSFDLFEVGSLIHSCIQYIRLSHQLPGNSHFFTPISP